MRIHLHANTCRPTIGRGRGCLRVIWLCFAIQITIEQQPVPPKFGEPLKNVTAEEGQKAVIEGTSFRCALVSSRVRLLTDTVHIDSAMRMRS